MMDPSFHRWELSASEISEILSDKPHGKERNWLDEVGTCPYEENFVTAMFVFWMNNNFSLIF